MTDKKNLKHAGAIVLGMHDALVELSGIIAGLTFAIEDSRIIILTAAIAAASASLSMAAASFQAQRADNNPDAGRAAAYTGITYIITSVLLIFPFTIIPNRFWALAMMGILETLIIFGFNCAIGIFMRRPFFKRFIEMLLICMGVSIASFIIAMAAKHFIGVQI